MTEHTQPEPDSGYALDRLNRLWRRDGDRFWNSTSWVELKDVSWATACERYGPMTPLLPAVRPDGVPDDAVPFVGWVAGTPKDGYVVMSPNSNQIQELDDLGWIHDLGLPVPAAPAPSLPERLRELAHDVLDGLPMTNHAGYVKQQESTAALIREAADALEAGSQP